MNSPALSTSLILAGVAAAQVTAQTLPVRTFGANVVEFNKAFAEPVSVRELHDGRVIISDLRDGTLQIITFGGRAVPLGRKGGGPAEWARPGVLLPLVGDSTLMPDVGNKRFLIIDPCGNVVRIARQMSDLKGQARSVGDLRASIIARQAFLASAVDARGRLYFLSRAQVDLDLATSRSGSRARLAPDSLPLLRGTLRSPQFDTIAWLREAPSFNQYSAPGRGVYAALGALPFQSSDTWAVFPDGRVAIVRANDYRIDMISPAGVITRGSPVPYVPVRITSSEKDQWRKRTVGPVPSGMLQNTPLTKGEPVSWPAAKSPFEQGAVFAAPNGETWVFLSRAAADSIPTADVFDASGNRIARLVFPARTRIIGFGAASVYAVRFDNDDHKYL